MLRPDFDDLLDELDDSGRRCVCTLQGDTNVPICTEAFKASPELFDGNPWCGNMIPGDDDPCTHDEACHKVLNQKVGC
jgi:hypothetical protein